MSDSLEFSIGFLGDRNPIILYNDHRKFTVGRNPVRLQRKRENEEEKKRL